ncbi:hypothetical protein AA18889_0183 [Acetobacter senegalensis DSM 18889]|nr:hypothetical protein AA18889_0183 [Acetobacter senegalensis DSM 18889]
MPVTILATSENKFLWRKTVSDTRYKIEEADNGFALVAELGLFGNPPREIARVPYSITQEAESGIDAASHTSEELKVLRKQKALSLARYVTSLFIENDPSIEHLLKIRNRVEKLVTASIAELRKENGVNCGTKAGA